MYMYAKLQDGVQNKFPYGDNQLYCIISYRIEFFLLAKVSEIIEFFLSAMKDL